MPIGLSYHGILRIRAGFFEYLEQYQDTAPGSWSRNAYGGALAYLLSDLGGLAGEW